MKTRRGFVSNSSSSSFIILGKEEYKKPEKLHTAYFHHNMIMIPQTFGGNWDYTRTDTFDTFPDRLNAAALLAYQREGPGNCNDYLGCEWTDMLEEILIEDFDVEGIKINFRFDDQQYHYAFQDPCIVYESYFFGSETVDKGDEIFKDKETLRRWLYAPDSHVKVVYS